MTKSTGASNYLCVDEAWDSPNDDTDYVHTDSTSNVEDKYNMQNHTTETGTINYVRLVSRAKSHTWAQDSAGIFKLYIYEGTTGEYSESKGPLSISYSKYYHTWDENPDTSAAWTWSEIDAMLAGIQTNSPSYALAKTLAMRPNGDGSSTAMVGTYADVDEEDANDDTDYVYPNNTSGEREYFALADHTTETGTINSVTVFARMKWVGSNGDYDQPKIGVKTDPTYHEEIKQITATWATYSHEWTTNPDTSAAWTWTDIDNLQIGVWGRGATSTNGVLITQMYAVVDYTETDSPSIRATQVYAIVNYDPTATVVTLPDPKNVDLSHSRLIKRKNLPSGNYIVYDAGRGSKTLTIVGTETSAAYTDMNSMKTICHYGAKVTIAGLDDTNLNTDYWVSDISFSAGPGYPTNMYDYKLTLEAL